MEPDEFRQLISHIRLVESINVDNDQDILTVLSSFLTTNELDNVKLAMKPVDKKSILDCEMDCRLKLGKSLVYRNNLTSGATLHEDDICAKVNEPFGISAELFSDFVGRILIKDVVFDENLDEKHFQQ